MRLRINGHRFTFLILLSWLATIFSAHYNIFESSSQIAFSNILKYNITIKDNIVANNLSSEILSSSVLSINVIVKKSEDCIKNLIGCSQPLRIYGKLNEEPIIENLSFDKKDDIGSYSDTQIIYSLDYSPCQYKFGDTINVKLVGIEGKFNFTISIFYDYQDSYKIICAKGISPPNYLYPAVVNNDNGKNFINPETISFGGKIKDSYDNIIYYLGSDLLWKEFPKNDKGETPCGRYGHFLSIFERKLILFGGKDKNEISLNDLWIFDMDKLIWTQINYSNISSNVPKPKFLVSGCLIERNGIILLFGGKNSEDNYIYLLNLNILMDIFKMINDKKYSNDDELIAKLKKLWSIKIDTNLISRYGHTITKISDSEVMIFGGFDNNDNAVSNSDVINIDSFVVKNFNQENEERPRSRGFHNIMAYGPILFLYGGKSSNREILNDFWKYIISQNKWIKLKEINEFYLFRSGYIFTKLNQNERPVIYGGENKNKDQVTDMILLNFPICSSDLELIGNNICLPCAEGHILNNNKMCEMCGIGTYSNYTKNYIESKCNLCPKGTYSEKKGSFQIQSCKICKTNTFNDELGMATCKQCQKDELCYPKASTFKINDTYYLNSYMKKSSLIEENYPHLTSSKSEEISVWRVYGVYIVSSISILFIVVLLIGFCFSKKKTVISLINLDFIPISGIFNFIKGGSTKKCSGGIITMLYLIVVLGMIFSFCIRYIYYNDLVEVIPISNSNNQGNIKFSFNIGIELIGFSEECINEQKKFTNTTFFCSNSIQIKKSGTDLQLPYFCSISNNICRIDINCENCKSISNNDIIEIYLKNENSYVSFYRWNFHTIWYKTIKNTEGYSKLTGIIKPDENPELNYVFKGNDPTKITFLLTPIFFYDKVRNNHISGYRANQKSFQLGSLKNNYNFYSINSGVKLNFEVYFKKIQVSLCY